MSILNPRVIYVVGWGRSGSTLLGGLLARRVGGIAVGEIERIWELGFRKNRRCSCGDAFLDCPFWVEVASEAGLRSGEVADSERLVREWTRWRKLPQVMSRNGAKPQPSLVSAVETLRRLYEAVHRVSGGLVVVDSSKSPLYAWLLQRERSIRWDFVHLVRDGRAVAFSNQRTRRDTSATQERFLRKSGPIKSATEWNLRNSLAAALALSSSVYRRVRYEDLAESPVDEVERVARGLGYPELKAVDSEATVTYASQHMLGGNPAKLVPGESKVRADDAWRAGLTRGRRWVVTGLSAPWLVAFGYPIVVRSTTRQPQDRHSESRDGPGDKGY